MVGTKSIPSVSSAAKHTGSGLLQSSTKDDSPLKARFFAVRKEIYNRYKENQQTEQQAASTTLKRVMSECERESEVIEIDHARNDINLDMLI